MQSSNAPSKIQLPFAASGTKNTIPVPSQQGVTPGAASFTDGFPPLTFTPLSAGGVPPAGADFNGIFNALSAIQQWQSAGGLFKYDATFSTAIGGYPKGAVLLNSSGTGLWVCTTENNTTNPDAAGAGWLAFSPSSIQGGIYSSAPDTGTVNALAITLSPAPAALTPGMEVTVTSVAASNTGNTTLNVNGLGAIPALGANSQALQGGELIGGNSALFRLNGTGTNWMLVYTSAGATPVAPATKSNHAVNLGQFGSSVGASGYRSIPDPNDPTHSTLIQWGTGFITSSSTSTPITFPLAFQVECGIIIPVSYPQNSSVVAQAFSATLNGFSATACSSSSGTLVVASFSYIAIGK